MKKIRILSLLLALITVASLFAACGEGADTTVSEGTTEAPESDVTVTDVPATDAPATDAPETDAPETDAPETEAPETEAPVIEETEIEEGVVVENGVFKSAWFDFESQLGIVDYVNGMGGFSVNEKLDGGEIADGKWVYSGSPIAIKDDCGIYDLDSFSLRFDICFNSFVNKDGTSVFTFITDDDGVLGSSSVFYALKMDMDGKLYHFNQKEKAMQLEKGKAYSIRYDVNRLTKKAEIYFNDTPWVSAGFALANDAYNYFRFMDSGRGADVWFDNFIITDEPIVFNSPNINNSSSGGAATDASGEDTDGGFDEVMLDFNTNLSLTEYIASSECFEGNPSHSAGAIENNRWVYTGGSFVIEDKCGIYDAKTYNLEFDFCFNKVVNKDNTAVFSFMTDDDGNLDGSSSSWALRMDADGKLYPQGLVVNAIQVELGKVYHIRYEINRETQNAAIYLDGSVWVSSIGYKQANQVYNCFRFMFPGRGADMWIDNFFVANAGVVKNDYVDVEAVDAAHVRAGQLADKPQKLGSNGGLGIDIKYSDGNTNTPDYREGLIKFDISNLDPDCVGYTRFMGEYLNMTQERTFDIYWIEEDWNGETVTFNTLPEGYLIARNIAFGGAGAPLDLAPYLIEAIKSGDKTFSIRIVPTFQDGGYQTKIFYGDGKKPIIRVFPDKTDKSYFEKLVENESQNKAIWDYAQQMFDEWNARYKAITLNENAKKVEPDSSQYIRSSLASEQSSNFASNKKSYNSRPFEALTDLDKYVSSEFKNAKRDEYGGIMIESLKQKATGYFYTTKIEGRWFVIDPLGYPYIIIGLSLIDYSLNGSETQAKNTLNKYKTYENWAIEVTKEVRDGFGFNSTFNPRAEITKVDGGLPYVKALPGVMTNYALAKNGTAKAIENNVVPAFDPDFVEYANYNLSKAVANYVNDPKVIGYTVDNELPVDFNMLDNALSIAHKNPVNHYTYACAWTWLVNMTGKESPTYDDITDELRDLYRGFVYDRYFYVVASALEKADPNHMYMGCKFLPYVKDSKWIFAFAGQHVDITTINWYFCWEPETDVLYNIEKYGDTPIMISEFYTKADDATVSSEVGSPKLTNTSGAGWFVQTQEDRADFYDTFVIKLLESNIGVGWQWFHYMDNDPNSGTSDKTSVNSNKGICRSDLTYYTELTDRMTELNKNVYNIVDYFANKNSK